jgi:hypothetical protein
MLSPLKLNGTLMEPTALFSELLGIFEIFKIKNEAF